MSILAAILPDLFSVLSRIIPDANQRAQATEEITKIILSNEATVMNAARDIVVAEVSSETPLVASWRPILMYFLMFLIAWIGVIAPIFGLSQVTVEGLKAVPDNLWNLLMIGMGGYIVGRSGEKIAESLARKKG